MTEDALIVKNLTVSYDSNKNILHNVSFSVGRGTTAVIKGSSGCGKSTLCSALCGLMPSVISADISGSIMLHGRDGECVETVGMNPSGLCRLIGMVFQNPDDQIICTAVEDEIAFGLENMMVPPEEMRRRVDMQLDYFRIKHLAKEDPSRLSGGQKKLVTIASVLVMEPEVLILDEPMTGLDEPARRLVYDAIIRLRDDGRTLIVVEHWTDRADYADYFIDMQQINHI